MSDSNSYVHEHLPIYIYATLFSLQGYNIVTLGYVSAEEAIIVLKRSTLRGLLIGRFGKGR